MRPVRCYICRTQVPNVKILRSHYMLKHSKFTIIKQLLHHCQLRATPKLLIRRGKTRDIGPTSSEDSTRMGHRSKATRRRKKYHQVGVKLEKAGGGASLNECSGEFYECHCMDVSKGSSDTETCSTTSKALFCNYCGNGYSTLVELNDHEKLHQLVCTLCGEIINLQTFREHFFHHTMRIYTCYFCGVEHTSKEFMFNHLWHHFEQQTFENILNLEEEYNMTAFPNFTGDRLTDVNNIIFFLTYPYDHHHSRNLFQKVICNICCQQFYLHDFDNHVKIVHGYSGSVPS